MSGPLDDLQSMFADFISDVSARALASDPQTTAALTKLDGRVLEIQVTQPPITWHMTFATSGLRLHPGQAEQPHLIVRGDAIALISWLMGKTDSQIQVDGDAGMLLALSALFQHINPDPAAALSSVLGPQRAADLLATAEMGLAGVKSALQGVGLSLKDTAAENFVDHNSFNDLLGGIDDLRLRVDRLAANIKAKERRE